MFWVNDAHWVWLNLGHLLRLALLAGLVVLVIVAIRALSRTQASRSALAGPSAAQTNTPLEILKQRYARGEITKEEYESMRQDLMT